VYPPAALAAAAGGYGDPVDLERLPPDALVGYPLIVTRRDPSQPRPPAAYSLAWHGAYYEVWKRAPHAGVTFEHRALSGGVASQCSQLGELAARAPAHAGALAAAPVRELVRVSLAGASHPRHWGHAHGGLVMGVPGRLRARFTLPSAGTWDVWVQGEIMPTVSLSVDGRTIARIGGQLSGNSLVPDTSPPLPVTLTAGKHTVSVVRSSPDLSPGARGSAVLDGILLTPGDQNAGALDAVTPRNWRSLCGARYEWAELLSL
jgi:hypothetical protein